MKQNMQIYESRLYLWHVAKAICHDQNIKMHQYL